MQIPATAGMATARVVARGTTRAVVETGATETAGAEEATTVTTTGETGATTATVATATAETEGTTGTTGTAAAMIASTTAMTTTGVANMTDQAKRSTLVLTMSGRDRSQRAPWVHSHHRRI